MKNKRTDYLLISILCLFLCLLLLLSGCAGQGVHRIDLKLSESIEAQMDEVYDPWYEKAYCVDLKKGIVWNVRDGGACWVVFPEDPPCNPDDIEFHTHPWNCERFANIFDGIAFRTYYDDHGVDLYGIRFWGSPEAYKIYKVEK